MKFAWQIEPTDIAELKAFYKKHRDNSFVRERRDRNLASSRASVKKRDFWYVMVGCLLTTQQRSGPDSAVSRFINQKPFSLRYEVCVRESDLEGFVQVAIGNFGGLRRANKISDEIVANLSYLEQGGWEITLEKLGSIQQKSSPAVERRVAEHIEDHFKGFGPKQSRNLIQWLGLSRYEIPLDSRITKWLNDFGFPIKLSAKALQDRNYYGFVSDGVRQLAKASGVTPCELDAAIFSSFDESQLPGEDSNLD